LSKKSANPLITENTSEYDELLILKEPLSNEHISL